jgi:hypothetical protein
MSQNESSEFTRLVLNLKTAGPKNGPAVLDGIEALKRWLYGDAYQGPAGPAAATWQEATELTDALVAWGDAYGNIDMTQLAAYLELCRLAYPQGGIASGTVAGLEHFERKMEEGFRLADSTLNRLKNRIRTRVDEPVEPATSIERSADFWEIRFQNEHATFKHRRALPWLAKLLSKPHHRWTVAELLGDEEGKLAADALLRRQPQADREAVARLRKQLEELDEIEAQFSGLNTEQEREKVEILRELDTADKALKSALVRAYDNIRKQVKTLIGTIKKDMPKLAAHLKAAIKPDCPELAYSPPAGTTSWKT